MSLTLVISEQNSPIRVVVRMSLVLPDRRSISHTSRKTHSSDTLLMEAIAVKNIVLKLNGTKRMWKLHQMEEHLEEP